MESFAKNVQIRPMTAADLTRVKEIAASLQELPHWPDSAFQDALNPQSMPRRVVLVVSGSQPEHVQGFTVASFLPPQAELEAIAVAAGSQRQGLGCMLFDALVNELRMAGVFEIVLEVRVSNRAALAFYRSAGFGQTGLRRAYYVDPVEDAVVMRLQFF